MDNAQRAKCLRYAELCFKQQMSRHKGGLTPEETDEMALIENELGLSRHQILEKVHTNFFHDSSCGD